MQMKPRRRGHETRFRDSSSPNRVHVPGPTRLRMKPVARTCSSGKVCFETMQAAMTAAEAAMENGNVDPGCHVEPYACPDCHTHHIGNRRIIFPDDQWNRGDIPRLP